MEERAQQRKERRQVLEQKYKEAQAQKELERKEELRRQIEAEENEKKMRIEKKKQEKLDAMMREEEKLRRQELAVQMNNVALMHADRASLINYGIRPWLRFMKLHKAKVWKAGLHYAKHLHMEMFRAWMTYVYLAKRQRLYKYKAMVKVAVDHHTSTVTSRVMGAWYQMVEFRRYMETAAGDYRGIKLKHYTMAAWKEFHSGALNARVLVELRNERRADATFGRNVVRKCWVAWEEYSRTSKMNREKEQWKNELWGKVSGWLKDPKPLSPGRMAPELEDFNMRSPLASRGVSPMHETSVDMGESNGSPVARDDHVGGHVDENSPLKFGVMDSVKVTMPTIESIDFSTIRVEDKEIDDAAPTSSHRPSSYSPSSVAHSTTTDATATGVTARLGNHVCDDSDTDAMSLSQSATGTHVSGVGSISDLTMTMTEAEADEASTDMDRSVQLSERSNGDGGGGNRNAFPHLKHNVNATKNAGVRQANITNTDDYTHVHGGRRMADVLEDLSISLSPTSSSSYSNGGEHSHMLAPAADSPLGSIAATARTDLFRPHTRPHTHAQRKPSRAPGDGGVSHTEGNTYKKTRAGVAAQQWTQHEATRHAMDAAYYGASLSAGPDAGFSMNVHMPRARPEPKANANVTANANGKTKATVRGPVDASSDFDEENESVGSSSYNSGYDSMRTSVSDLLLPQHKLLAISEGRA
eukprot:GFYU01003790.1.p2 GENE.GFYU01003790.1~~GFYU01003790.1.p2  ORF type:complete len:698 (-),score=235.45 GFYU01003790.1:649-2742(-)